MKSCNSKIKTHFRDKETPQESFHHICLSMILIGSVLKKMINIVHKCF